MMTTIPTTRVKAQKAFRRFQMSCSGRRNNADDSRLIQGSHDPAPVGLPKSLDPLINNQIENFLFRTSSALASSWKPLAINPAEAPLPMAALLIAPFIAAPVPRGLLVALLLPAALVGSELDGVGFGCSSAERLALLPLTLGGDWERARGGGVEACTEGRGPGIVRPAAPPAFSCSCCRRGDSSLNLICARCGDLCCGGTWL